MSFAKRIFLIFFSLVAAAVLAAIFLSGPLLKSLVTAQISARSGLETRLSGAGFDVWPALRIKLVGLQLRAPNRPGDTPVFSADEASFALPYASLMSGHPQIADIGLAHPVLQVAALHDLAAAPKSTRTATPSDQSVTIVGPLVITDGVIVDDNKQRHAIGRIDAIALRAAATPEGKLALSLAARAFGKTVYAEAKAASAADLLAGRATRIDVAADAEPMTNPAAAPAVSLRSTLRFNSAEIAFDDVTGIWQGGQLNAAGKVRFDGEAPRLTADVRLDRLDLGAAQRVQTSAPDAHDATPLNDTKLDLKSLRLLDAAIDLNVAEMRAAGLTFGNVALKTTLDRGALRLALAPADFYRGKVAADLSLDAAQDLPAQRAKITLTGVRAAPLLADLAGLDEVDGTLQLKADLASSGASPKAIMRGLAGRATLAVSDGVVSGHRLPDLFQSVAKYLPGAWRNLGDKITVDAMTANFTLANGVASTSDLHIMSPVADVDGSGNIDLADRSFDLRFDPKVKSGETSPSQNASALDLGAAILVRGPWNDPQISADLSGLMRDPQKTLDTLQSLGQQFLGGSDKPSEVPADDIMKGVGSLLKGFGGQDGPRRPH